VALTSRPHRRRLVKQFRLTRQGYERSKFTFIRFDHYGYLLSMLVNIESLQIHLLVDPYSLLLQCHEKESKLREMTITSSPFVHWDVLLTYFQRNPDLRRLRLHWEPHQVIHVPLTTSEPMARFPTYPQESTLPLLEEICGPWEIVKVVVPGRPISKLEIIGDLPSDAELDGFCEALTKSGSEIRYFKCNAVQLEPSTLDLLGKTMPALEELHVSDIDRARDDVVSRFQLSPSLYLHYCCRAATLTGRVPYGISTPSEPSP
jgi:hypothetical protein